VTDKFDVRTFKIILFIFVVMGCSSAPRRDIAEVVFDHVVFDLDGTLLYTVDDSYEGRDGVYRFKDEYYKTAFGSAETIQYLLDQENVKISFFSGGSKERNLSILKKIKLDSGLSLLDIAYKVFHQQDLSSEKTKDLLKVSRDLDHVVLVDDQLSHIHVGQSQNMFHIESAYWYFENFESVMEERLRFPDKTYLAPNLSEFKREKKKFQWILGILSTAISKESDEGLAQRVFRLTHDFNGKQVPRSSHHFERYFLKGERMLNYSCEHSLGHFIEVQR